MSQELGTVDEGNPVLHGPCLSVSDLQCSVSGRFEHLGTDDHRNGSSSTSQTHGQFCVALTALKTVFGFPTNRNVSRGTEHSAQCSDGLGLLDPFFEHLVRQFSEAARGQGTVPVGDASEGVTVVDGQREGRACIVLEIVGSEGVQHRMLFHQSGLGVQILEVRQPKRFTDLVADGQKQQATAFLPKTAHGRRVRGHGGKKKVGFPFAVFCVKDTYRFASGEGGKRCIEACEHVLRLGLPFKKGRIGSLLPDSATL